MNLLSTIRALQSICKELFNAEEVNALKVSVKKI